MVVWEPLNWELLSELWAVYNLDIRGSDNTEILSKKSYEGTSLAVQWLRLHASTAGDVGSIPDRGTKIPHAVQWGRKKKVVREG